MLKITINKNNNNIIENIIFNGHAEYDDYGKDIVCASASTMLITTVNAIIEFDSKAIKYENNEKFIIRNIKKDNITNKLLNNLVKLLEELESNYKENIKIVGGKYS